MLERTVDGDGEDLREDETISTDECGNASELVDLAVVGGDTSARVGLDELDIKLVGLGHSQKTDSAGVALKERGVSQWRSGKKPRRAAM